MDFWKTRKKLLLFGLVVILAGTACSQPISGWMEKLNPRAYALGLKQDPDWVEIDSVIALLKKDLEKKPNDTEKLVQLIRLLIEKGQYDLAQTYVDKALDLGPDNPAVKLALAEVQINTDKCDKALTVIDEVSKAYPEENRRIYLKAQADYCDGNIADALKTMREYLTAEPEDPDGYIGLADMLMQTGYYIEGISVLSEAADYFPDSWEIEMWRGLVNEGAGEDKIALSFLNKAETMGAIHPALNLSRARCLAGDDRFADAKADLLKALELGLTVEQKVEYYEAAVFTYVHLGDWNTARDLAAEGLEEDPVNEYLLYYSGYIADHYRDYEEAIEFYSIAIEEGYGDYDFYVSRAKSYMSLNQFEQALLDLEEAARYSFTDDQDYKLKHLVIDAQKGLEK